MNAPAAANDNDGLHTNNAHGDRIDPVVVNQDMRRLWEDHITWARLYIVSAIAGLPHLDATADRLLQSHDDIGDAIATFYGEDAGHALAYDEIHAHIHMADTRADGIVEQFPRRFTH